MNICASIIFPYSSEDKEIFSRLASIIIKVLEPGSRLHTSRRKPVLVVNRDTIHRGPYKKFIKFIKDEKREGLYDLEEKLNVEKTWAVDTCQMWLHGFGEIMGDIEEEDIERETTAILQIPGDLKYIQNTKEFLNDLVSMCDRVGGGSDLVIGDFDVEPQKSKYLIDLHGTYPLFYNWFPKVARVVEEEKGIKRPRSEFLAISIKFLKKILPYTRKFAYEQTLAFLIHAILDEDSKWQIDKINLGKIGDYEGNRGLKEAVDQIERTERMLKLLWREYNGKDNFSIADFQLLDRRSTSIREAALVDFENFLSEGQEDLGLTVLKKRVEKLENIIEKMDNTIFQNQEE